jgi:Na+/H+-dicarboxylate symporter
MDMFHQLQVLILVALVFLIAPAAIPPLRRYNRTLRLAALVTYVAGGLIILGFWWFNQH